MTKPRIGLIHTSATLVPVFEQLCRELVPDAAVVNVVDDSLIKDVIAQGGLSPAISRRVANQIAAAEAAGARVILVTCSSIGRAVELAAEQASAPVLRVDRPMAERAVGVGSRIGVIATLQTTLAPTTELIERCAAEAGRKVTLRPRLVEGAFEALMDGDPSRHDALVSEALESVAAECDVVALAQASMARVAAALPPSKLRPPILSSPRLGVERVAQCLLQSQGGAIA